MIVHRHGHRRHRIIASHHHRRHGAEPMQQTFTAEDWFPSALGQRFDRLPRDGARPWPKQKVHPKEKMKQQRMICVNDLLACSLSLDAGGGVPGNINGSILWLSSVGPDKNYTRMTPVDPAICVSPNILSTSPWVSSVGPPFVCRRGTVVGFLPGTPNNSSSTPLRS